jgi:hypothetical protein
MGFLCEEEMRVKGVCVEGMHVKEMNELASKETYRVTYVSKVLCLDCDHNWNHTHLIHAYFVKAFPIERTDLKRHLNKQSPI